VVLFRKPSEMPSPADALPGRNEPMTGLGVHRVLGTPITPPFPEGTERAIFGMGCFWGAERLFWEAALAPEQRRSDYWRSRSSYGLANPNEPERTLWRAPGMYTTAVGYSAGLTPNPTYQEVCTGRTGHNEVVLAVFDTDKTSYEALLKIFWEGHDPTQGMRQGNDVGTQYRSGIYWTSETQREAALASRDMFQAELSRAGYGQITTEIVEAGPFYYAEDYHQQYLEANPNGYCGLGGTGVSCPIGVGASARG
jgi:peptide-methionine (S)-S-oxide reductase